MALVPDIRLLATPCATLTYPSLVWTSLALLSPRGSCTSILNYSHLIIDAYSLGQDFYKFAVDVLYLLAFSIITALKIESHMTSTQRGVFESQLIVMMKHAFCSGL